MKRVVKFKSTPINYANEKSGKKPNTLRKKNLSDERTVMLGAMLATNDYGHIEIQNMETFESFMRKITDVTEHDGWLIISWKHKKDKVRM